MSRALNIKAAEADIVATCKKFGIGISMIERLHSGGTRIVLNNAADTVSIAKAYGSKLLTGPVTRMQTRLNRGHRGAGRGSPL
jgi:hypothetical protein